MNQQESPDDRNLEKLIRASFGPDARLTPETRIRIYRRLVTEWRETRQPKEFPKVILALFGGLFLLLAGMTVPLVWDAGARWPQIFTLNPFGILVLLNVAFLPIASLVIIIRRKSWANA